MKRLIGLTTLLAASAGMFVLPAADARYRNDNCGDSGYVQTYRSNDYRGRDYRAAADHNDRRDRDVRRDHDRDRGDWR
jgi:hypothetical protein